MRKQLLTSSTRRTQEKRMYKMHSNKGKTDLHTIGSRGISVYVNGNILLPSNICLFRILLSLKTHWYIRFKKRKQRVEILNEKNKIMTVTKMNVRTTMMKMMIGMKMMPMKKVEIMSIRRNYTWLTDEYCIKSKLVVSK